MCRGAWVFQVVRDLIFWGLDYTSASGTVEAEAKAHGQKGSQQATNQEEQCGSKRTEGRWEVDKVVWKSLQALRN